MWQPRPAALARLSHFPCTCVRALIVLLLPLGFLPAQETFNTVQRDRLTYPTLLNDVWGYVAPDGTEYALVGTRTGLSIVSLADPDNVVEVAFVAGATSVWRDIKTYGEFAYVVADQGGDGIVAVDLSNLPTGVTSVQYNTNNTPGAALTRAHNIYIDETTGRAYVAGSNRNAGGVVIYDVATTPGVPTFVAFAPAVYAHDAYVQDGVLYSSEISSGTLTLFDVNDPDNISFIGTVATPRNFTHNAWATADGQYVFTTDERGNAPTAAYDISDPNDIELLGEFRPGRSLNTNTIPHNVHVLGDYLVISHYTDGVEIVDASDPCNMVEVAYFDSWTGADGGGNGSWGAYPYLPSGLMLSSDISRGLYVFDVTLTPAARLKGRITDRTTGQVINNVQVTVDVAEFADTGTNALGDYKTGLATAGTYDVTFSHPGYVPVTVPVVWANGQEITLDTNLLQRALPVALSAFTAVADGKTNRLNWTTEAETGSDRFGVERSTDGRYFTEVATVAAAGQSTVRRHYAYTDAEAPAGPAYYRLRQVDADGSFTYSQVRRVERTPVLTVFPNPVTDELRLSAPAPVGTTIVSADGRTRRAVAPGARRVDVRDLGAGAYLLRAGGLTVPFVRR